MHAKDNDYDDDDDDSLKLEPVGLRCLELLVSDKRNNNNLPAYCVTDDILILWRGH